METRQKRHGNRRRYSWERYARRQLRLDHQAIDFDRGRRIAARRLAAHGPLQLEAFLAAGDLYVLRIDVLAETGKFEMTLIVGAGHKAGIAVLDFGAHLGIRDAAADSP